MALDADDEAGAWSLEGLDEIGLTMQKAPKIASFEKSAAAARPCSSLRWRNGNSS